MRSEPRKYDKLDKSNLTCTYCKRRRHDRDLLHLFVPQLICNLISISQLIDDSHCFVRFTSSLCAIQDQHSGNLIGASERRDGLYFFSSIPTIQAVSVPGLTEFELWHRRLRHPSDHVVKLVPAIRWRCTMKKLNKACVGCPQAKQTRDSFPTSNDNATTMFALIHCDLWGPYSTPSSCDAVYFLTIVDDFSCDVWVYLLRDKTEVEKAFTSFYVMVERQFETHVKIVRTNNGTELNCMLDYFTSCGILFQTSCVMTP